MNKFKMAVKCPNCEELVIQDGYTIDATVAPGVITLNLFEQEHFRCTNCGTDIFVGDIEDVIEYETPEE